MAKEKPKITVSEPSEELFKRVEKLFYLLIGAMFIGFISLLIMVAGMVIETWRFNSYVYKESQQLRLQEEIIKNTVEQQKLMLKSLQRVHSDLEKLNESKK